MVKLFDCPAGLDLAPFAGWLWQQRIRHRITHLDGGQQLWLADPREGEYVLEQFQRWRKGQSLDLSVEPKISHRARLSLAWYQFPVTLVLIGLSLLLSLLSGLGENYQWLRLFSFVDFVVDGQYLKFYTLEAQLGSGQWWRLVTPIFLHFGLLHLVFNLLWTWELGRRVEVLQGKRRLLWLALMIGVLSNIAQFMMTGPLFGGLSGVIFGLMGYTWLWDRMNPHQRFGLPSGLMTFMLIWLLVGITGLIDQLGFGSIANTAHLIGLLVGLACVWPARWLERNKGR